MSLKLLEVKVLKNKKNIGPQINNNNIDNDDIYRNNMNI